MDDVACDAETEARGALVPLPRRTRRDQQAAASIPPTTALVDAAGLTRAERAVLFGDSPIDETTQAGAVMAAATGLMKLAAQHVARRLAAPAAPTLTAQDRLAMALVPSLAIQLRQSAPIRNATEGDIRGARDPILELLVKMENHPGASEEAGE